MQEWWRPDRFATRRGRLEQRGRILGAVRSFFAADHGLRTTDQFLPAALSAKDQRDGLAHRTAAAGRLGDVMGLGDDLGASIGHCHCQAALPQHG